MWFQIERANVHKQFLKAVIFGILTSGIFLYLVL
ncbi:hypothetical protein MNBD_ALPHA01-330 [hydrothermal vent metagenome]|uniref:Uncharacterized protein n=1 Tax=hydrothermal vent metagenome TaxID=652676 RepID=A0A3B0R839_9ZZZZ